MLVRETEGNITLEMLKQKTGGRVWSVFFWLRTGTGGGFL
jgi:hypothetical protein